MRTARRIHRVMEEHDLPVRPAARELLLEPRRAAPCPCSCCRGQRTARSRSAGLEGVVALAVHVERLVEPLVGVVVIPERGVELHARVEQRLVRLLELLDVVPRAAAAVQVVAEHQHEVEREGCTRSGQSFGHLVSPDPPVPLSPITAKCTESFWFGNVMFWAGSAAPSARTRPRTATMRGG